MVMKVIIIILHIDQGQFVGNAQVDQNDSDHITALEYEKIVTVLNNGQRVEKTLVDQTDVDYLQAMQSNHKLEEDKKREQLMLDRKQNYNQIQR